MDFNSWIVWLLSLIGLAAFFGLPEPKPELDVIRQGRIEHVIPRRFVEGGVKPASVRISRDASEDLFETLPPDAKREFQKIQIEDNMQVNLVSSPREAFDIISLTPSEQHLPPSGYTRWEWDVEALKPGDHELIVTAGIVLVDHSGNESQRTVEVFRRNINVEVSLFEATKRFLAATWQWLVGFAAIAAAIIAYFQYKKPRGT